MTYIYEPRGRAREYSPLALNVYSGCDHGCLYCYNRPRFPCDEARPRDINWTKFAYEVADIKDPRQVLLSFVGDPYCHAEPMLGRTRMALTQLSIGKMPTAILTKGGTRCLRDIALFKHFGVEIKVGATMTFLDPERSREWEPNAATPRDRMVALRTLNAAGIYTWASLEPVIDPEQTLAIIEALTRPECIVNEIRVGRWNHDKRANAINWHKFGWDAYDQLSRIKRRSYGFNFYLKEDLRRAMAEKGTPLVIPSAFQNPDEHTAGRLYA